MTELQLNMKKGSLKKLLAMLLVVCLCLTTFPANGIFVQAAEVTADASGDNASDDNASDDDGSKDDPTTEEPTTEAPTTEAPTTEAPTTEAPAAVNVTGVTLDKTAVDVNVGKTVKLTAIVAPVDAADKAVTWTSSNPNVATVAADGTVTAVAKGTATITVTTKDGKKIATCNVTVKVPATKVTVSSKKVYVVKGKSVSVKAYVQPLDTTDKVEWTSSNTAVATVKNGKISAKKVGKATITAKAGDKTAKVTVNVVKKAVKAKSVKLNKKSAVVKAGNQITLTAKLNPTKSTDTLKWSSSNKKVATVDQYGVVTAKKAGTATITVKTSSGKKATCKITVPGVTLKKKSATVKVGKTTTIQVKSKTVKNDKVKSYKSSDTTIATVTKKGKVKGIKAGKATITVTMKSGATATFKVTVK